MNPNRQLLLALDLIDFCRNDLSTSLTADFFSTKDLTHEQENSVFLMALSLAKKIS